MSVDRREVRRIAELARLRFEDDEVERLTDELNGILEHVEALRTAVSDAAGDGDEGYATGRSAPTRPDERAEADPLGSGPAAIAPRFTDGFFVVPPPPGVQAPEGA